MDEFLADSDRGRVLSGCVPIEKGLNDVIEALSKCDLRERNEEDPLFWPVEQIGNIPKRGTFAAGRLRGEAVA